MSWPLNQATYSRILQIEGDLTHAEETLLCDAAEDATGIILEINPYQGRTTAVLAAACSDTPATVYCIDPWPHIYFRLWLENLTATVSVRKCLPIRGEPMDVLRVMGAHLQTQVVDLVVLHCRQQLFDTLAIMTTCLAFLKPGGKIMLRQTKESQAYFQEFIDIASKIIHNCKAIDNTHFGVKL